MRIHNRWLRNISYILMVTIMAEPLYPFCQMRFLEGQVKKLQSAYARDVFSGKVSPTEGLEEIESRVKDLARSFGATLKSATPQDLKSRLKDFQKQTDGVVSDLKDQLNTLLDDGGPAVTLGRTVEAVADTPNQATITYHVINNQFQEINSISLSTTLAEGVTLISSSLPSEEQNSEHVWSLGKIMGGHSVQVKLRVAITDSNQEALDQGSHVSAYRGPEPVEAEAIPAVLANLTECPDCLASTPDARKEDPYIAGKAAELGYNAATIFEFVRDDIGNEVYTGSMRGSRGTLWNAAGNAVDKSSLLIALLRHSGIPCHYVSGTVNDELARQKFVSMFPNEYQVVGGSQGEEEVADYSLEIPVKEEARQHCWVEYQEGSSWKAMDPSFAEAEIGTTLGTEQERYSELPDALRHKIQVKLNIEKYSAWDTANNGLTQTKQLDHTFNSVELAGKTISLGHMVDSDGVGGMISANITHNYTPYLLVFENDGVIADDQIYEGTAYQEFYSTMFGPLVNSSLTGAFLEVTSIIPGQASKKFERTLVDRLGYDARNGLATAHMNLTGETAAFNPMDTFTIETGAYQVPTDDIIRLFNNMTELQKQVSDAQAALEEDAEPTSEMIRDYQYLTIMNQAYESFSLANYYQARQDEYAQTSRVKPVYCENRLLMLTLLQQNVEGSTSTLSLKKKIDFLHDTVSIFPNPGQLKDAELSFRAIRGLLVGITEDLFFQKMVDLYDSSEDVQLDSYSIVDMFGEAEKQGIPIQSLQPGEIHLVDSLSITNQAKSRISKALEANKTVIVPSQMVSMRGTGQIGWYEIDPQTMELIDSNEEGEHYAILLRITQLFITLMVPFIAIVFIHTMAIVIMEISIATNNYDGKQVARNLLKLAYNILSYCGTYFRDLRQKVQNTMDKYRFSDPPLNGLSYGGTDRLNNTPSLEGTSHYSANLSTTALASFHSRSLQSRRTQTLTYSPQLGGLYEVNGISLPGASCRNLANNQTSTGRITLDSPSEAVLARVQGANVVSGSGVVSLFDHRDSRIYSGGNWGNSTASLANDATLEMETGRLQLNGAYLPTSQYLLTAPSGGTINGSGNYPAPQFQNNLQFHNQQGVLYLGPIDEGVQIEQGAYPNAHYASLYNYTGALSVQAANPASQVTLPGQSEHLMFLNYGPDTSIAAINNATSSFTYELMTSLEDDYTVSLVAPDGWNLREESLVQNKASVLFNPGVECATGTYEIKITAQSKTHPDFQTLCKVPVVVSTFEAKGIELDLKPDSLFTVPVNGALVPSAYQAEIANLNPYPVTVDLTLSEPPSGYKFLMSQSSVTIPAGKTGLLGVYLEPLDQVPPVGQTCTITATATSRANTSMTDSDTETFVVPEIHETELAFEPEYMNVLPGGTGSVNLSLTSLGNVPETLSLQAELPDGFSVQGLPSNAELTQGGSQVFPLVFTCPADATTTGVYRAEIIADLCHGTACDIPEPNTRTATLGIKVRMTESKCAADAAYAFSQMGEEDLASALSNMADGIEILLTNPETRTRCEQVLSLFSKLAGTLYSNSGLDQASAIISLYNNLVDSANAGKCSTDGILEIIPLLCSLSDDVSLSVEHGVVMSLSPSFVDLEPGEETSFNLGFKAIGSETTILDLTAVDVPDGATVTINPSQVTINPGDIIDANSANAVKVQLDQNMTGQSLFTLKVNGQAVEDASVVNTAKATVSINEALANVVKVDIAPSMVDAGTPVTVTAQIFNSANTARSLRATASLLSMAGDFVRDLGTKTLTLNSSQSLVDVVFSSIDTTGLTEGTYQICVALSTVEGDSIPGDSGKAPLMIGIPIEARAWAEPAVVGPGTSTVNTNISVVVSDVDTGCGDNFHLMKHFPTEDDYLIESQGITPSPTLFTNNVISWLNEYIIEGDISAHYMIPGVVSNMKPGETRQISKGTVLEASYTFVDDSTREPFFEDFEGLYDYLQPADEENTCTGAITDQSLLGWTHTPPDGWSIDNTNMGADGTNEWHGWSFTTPEFWFATHTGQERNNFTLASGIFTVADPDEWDDCGGAASIGYFNSTLISPIIPIPGNHTIQISFDNHYKPYNPGHATLTVIFENGDEQQLLHFCCNDDTTSTEYCDNMCQDIQNQRLTYFIESRPCSGTMVIKWHYFNGQNDWYWAFDNLSITFESVSPKRQ